MTTIFYPFSKSALRHHRITFPTFPEKRLRENKIRLRDLTICLHELNSLIAPRFFNNFIFFFKSLDYKQFACPNLFKAFVL